jgi:hypothetical protein
MLKTLRGEQPEMVPWNIHHALLRRGAFERRMRNRGLGIVEKSVHPYRAGRTEVAVEERRTVEDGALVLIRSFNTPKGALRSKTVVGPDGSPWIREYPVKNEEDMAILELIHQDLEYYPNDGEVISSQRAMGEDGLVLCRMMRSPLQRLLIEWMGTEGLIYALSDSQSEVDRLLSCMAESDVEAVRIASLSPAEAVWSAENITSTITSPPLFERYCLPYYNGVAEKMHAQGKLYGIHLDGKLAALKDLIDECSIDFVEGFTPPEMGDVSLEQARRAWPEKALWTNFPGNKLHLDDDDLIDYTIHLLREGMAVGRFMLTFTEDFPNPERSLQLVSEGIERFESEYRGE